MSAPKPTVILDFDGTVADSFTMAVEIAQKLLQDYGYPAWTAEQIAELRELSATQILKKVKVSPRHLPGMVRYVRREQKTHFHSVKPINGIEAVLKELAKHYSLAIVSSSETKLIEEFLIKYHLSRCISTVLGGAGLFSKNRNIRKLMKSHKLEATQVVYVGDEVRDIEAARKAHIPVISVSWGFNGVGALKRNNPDALATKPPDLATKVAAILPL